ncbi:unnamed protein product [Phaedon cochleariae]|uniref:Uncharacterized protein n=1 Tax=Phaedon cochleariae TaxID=80249 RepID=A0A9P0GNT1_PHACE|nr:unnamed protein product [Phaedon cochleariae]
MQNDVQNKASASTSVGCTSSSDRASAVDVGELIHQRVPNSYTPPPVKETPKVVSPFNAQEILSGLPGIEITKVDKKAVRSDAEANKACQTAQKRELELALENDEAEDGEGYMDGLNVKECTSLAPGSSFSALIPTMWPQDLIDKQLVVPDDPNSQPEYRLVVRQFEYRNSWW